MYPGATQTSQATINLAGSVSTSQVGVHRCRRSGELQYCVLQRMTTLGGRWYSLLPMIGKAEMRQRCPSPYLGVHAEQAVLLQEKEWLDAKRDFEEQKANPYTPQVFAVGALCNFQKKRFRCCALWLTIFMMRLQWYEILLEKLTPAALKNVPGSVARTWWLLTIGGSAMLTFMIYH